MLIFDLGANKGEDTGRYLHYAKKVVSVEADAVLCGRLRKNFAAEIDEGSVVVLNVGIWSEAGRTVFFKNMNDHWSSFDSKYGMRDRSGLAIGEVDKDFLVTHVETITLHDLFTQHGIPDFLKVDIEGADRIVVQDLIKMTKKPQFVSIEEYGPECIRDLRAAGYKSFKIIPQTQKTEWPAPYGEEPYTSLDSGPPPFKAPGEWLNGAQAENIMRWFVRDEKQTRGIAGEWYDVHATLD